MGISLIWHADLDHVLCLQFDQEWHWHDFHQAMQNMHQQVQGKSVTVYFDFPPGMRLPADGVFDEMREAIQQIEANNAIQKAAFIVADAQLQALFSEIVAHAAQNRQAFLVTFDQRQAIAFLAA